MTGCQLMGRKTPPTCPLTAVAQQLGGAWMQKGPVNTFILVLPFYEWGTWDPRRGVTCPNAESCAFRSWFFFFTHLQGEAPRVEGSYFVSGQGRRRLRRLRRVHLDCTCVQPNEYINIDLNHLPEECPWNMSRYCHQLLKLSRGISHRQWLGKTSKRRAPGSGRAVAGPHPTRANPRQS